MTTTTRTTKADAYHALQHASGQVGETQYNAQHAAHTKAGRSLKTFRYRPTAVHLTLVDAMADVLRERITVEEAYALVTSPDVLAERFGKDA